MLAGFLTGAPRSAVSVGWQDDPTNHLLFGSFGRLESGVGVLGIGVVPIAAAALLMAFRQRLVLLLVIGASVFVLAALTVQHSAHPGDAVRFDGHARNLGLLALLVALVVRLRALRFGWRMAAVSCLGVMVIWPTVALPVHRIPLSLSQGIEVANAQPGRGEAAEASGSMRRHVLAPLVSVAIADYIRDETGTATTVFSPHPHEFTAATGRPNASGPVGHLNLLPFEGPEYVDVHRFLEPGAMQRLGFAFVHATDSWIDALPGYARSWLADPSYFTPLIRDGTETLYRIEPAFLRLDSVYAPGSLEAMRQAVPASTPVYLTPGLDPDDSIRYASIRLAMALPHVQLLGDLDLGGVYLLTPLPNPVQPLAGQTADLVVLPARGLAASALAAGKRAPIWWNDEIAVYAPAGAIARLMEPPQGQFSVALAETRVGDSGIVFRADFTNRAQDLWVGQDWLVTASDGSRWSFPREFETDARHKGEQWFAGQVVPANRSVSFSYEFDPVEGRLLVTDASGKPEPVASSGGALGPGVWTLGVRLRQEWHEALFTPVMKFVVDESGDVSYEVYEGELSGRLAE